MSDERERARHALEELAFDHATGKLSDADYRELRARYEATLGAPPAAAPVAAGDTTSAEDRAEELIRRMRAAVPACPSCGPRDEPDAAFCSRCGRFLGSCSACGASNHPVGSRYCRGCGEPLLRRSA